MTRYAWAKWGDINGFFGLMLDNLAVMLILFVTTSGKEGFTPEFVLTRMLPGSALGVLIGDLVYTWMAFRLARRTGRSDVTAMPLGIDTPSTFAVAFLVLLPALKDGKERFPNNSMAAMEYAWHIGAVVLVLVGAAKSIAAPLGNKVRQWVPRAGMLGSLLAIAICLIAFLPLLDRIATVPVVGLLALVVILVALVAHRPLPGNVPGALAALGLGMIVYYVCLGLQPYTGPLVPKHVSTPVGLEKAELFPLINWSLVWRPALEKLPIMLPFALATIVGGIDCTESAATVGDEYDTRSILLTEGLASVAAGLFGGVLQNTPYIGHPAYKAMGSRAAYTLATGLFVGAAGYLGWFPVMFDWLPPAAMFPILVFVGIEITAQSFRATPLRHYPALAFSILPALAALGHILVGQALGGRESAAETAVTLRCLYNGFIITSLLWGAAMAALLDSRLRACAAYLGVAGAFSLFGIIHSPLPDAPIQFPHIVMERLEKKPVASVQTPEKGDGTKLEPAKPEKTPGGNETTKKDTVTKMEPVEAEKASIAPIQTPYHWAAAYGLCALFVLALEWFPVKVRQHEGDQFDAEGRQA
jgi:AGZA family xanthine/uracil permease-like MFS transporter